MVIKMEFKFKLNQRVIFKFLDSKYHGRIAARASDKGEPYYLFEFSDNNTIGFKPKTLLSGQYFESRVSDLIDDSLYIWALGKDLIAEDVTVPTNKKQSIDKSDLGRWLSGIDQYSEDNYNRGNSGFNWL